MLLVFVGGGLGSVLRLGAYRLTEAVAPGMFPWGTLIVNIIGGLAIGGLWGFWTGRPGAVPDQAALFLMTGVLGGFTTFSAFSLDTVLLWQRGAVGLAAAYILMSVVLSVGAVLAGVSAARLLS